MEKIKTDKPTLRKFGLIMALVFILLSLVIFVRHKYFSSLTIVIALLFVLAAVFLPVLLKYLYIFWMKFAYLLSWINARILLGVIFYFIFSPVGLLMRLFKVDLLGKNSRDFIVSYWKIKTDKKSVPADYRHQS